MTCRLCSRSLYNRCACIRSMDRLHRSPPVPRPHRGRPSMPSSCRLHCLLTGSEHEEGRSSLHRCERHWRDQRLWRSWCPFVCCLNSTGSGAQKLCSGDQCVSCHSTGRGASPEETSDGSDTNEFKHDGVIVGWATWFGEIRQHQWRSLMLKVPQSPAGAIPALMRSRLSVSACIWRLIFSMTFVMRGEGFSDVRNIPSAERLSLVALFSMLLV